MFISRREAQLIILLVFFDDSPVIPHFPFDRNIDFVGREDILGDMRAQLSDSKCLALNGIGGVG